MINTEKIKPIHKYNGGKGATICNACRVIISTGLTDELFCDDCWAKIEAWYPHELQDLADHGLAHEELKQYKLDTKERA